MHLLRSVLTLSAIAVAATVGLVAQASAATAATDKYPLTTCVVSGDKLGEMGAPVTYVYKQAGKPDRVLEFCCKDCIKDFEKDPAKYLAKYDAAVAGKPVAAAADTKTGAACCAGATMSCAADQDGCGLVKAYVPIATALAADDLAAAKNAAATLAKQADAAGQKAVYTPALALVHAADIAGARTAFKSLSAAITPMAEKSKGYIVMNCPMANADWVQTDAKVRNPYYGKKMLSCGAPKSSAM